MKDKVYEYKANSKDFFEALVNNAKYCNLLQKTEVNATYQKLLNWIVSYQQNLTSEEKELPALKDVYKLAGISYSHIGTDLRDVYYAIYKLNLNEPRKFVDRNQQVYNLQFNCFGELAYFRLGLDIVPRIGEEFIFPFIKPVLGTNSFYVKNIQHEICDWGSLVTMQLTLERPNFYLKLLAEKAFLNEEINIYEYSGTAKQDISQKLLKLYKNL